MQRKQAAVTPTQPVKRIKQNLLNQARAKFGSDPKLMASIEQNLNGYVRTHVVPVAPLLVPVVKPPNPNSQRMLNPQPLPPGNRSLQNRQLPVMQR